MNSWKTDKVSGLNQSFLILDAEQVKSNNLATVKFHVIDGGKGVLNLYDNIILLVRYPNANIQNVTQAYPVDGIITFNLIRVERGRHTFSLYLTANGKISVPFVRKQTRGELFLIPKIMVL